ncbi:MAG: hypothetical protein COY66_05510 [Candidatus Kerfeldbacteria bacterium CG_4_10_14_0_8_um_filter_42_10]|uniref:Methyltransferase type 11 domain-containing protein n=1 Tax=Candidatus Kerfeldbacteria bacterium CG_4_10_14_0_8_um_filter_42_10 TaxID=2014248 RepID=A0A2M7RGY0_9BACT|nr:MAG: hypothetical protein COY66_05510 [Candidatus Kerfeldbacteria bacterium CG_4_10_14_0_8_um_filter_42_10]
MQTPAEKYLIQKVVDALKVAGPLDVPKILNLGAGKSIVIEESVAKGNNKFICDRIDVIDQHQSHPSIGRCFIGSIESMPDLKTESYLVAFANYVLEHVADLEKAIVEIKRVLKPGGLLILSLPNPSAPEFIVSKYTPTWFHQFIKGKGRGKEAYETHYAYKSIKDLIRIFQKNNFLMVETKYYPFSYGYLYRFPVINLASKIYDKIIGCLKVKILMGNVCLVFKKQEN